MVQWGLVGVIVLSTVLGDLLQSIEMKRHGEVHFSGWRFAALLANLASRRHLVAAVVFMAISFFAFMKLLSLADLSFAVPATAASFVVETLLAKTVLRERVDSRRWAGALLVACGVALLAL